MRLKILVNLLLVLMVVASILIWSVWSVEHVTSDTSSSVVELKHALPNVGELDITECEFEREYSPTTSRGIPGPDDVGAMIVGRAQVRSAEDHFGDDVSDWIAVERSDVSQHLHEQIKDASEIYRSASFDESFRSHGRFQYGVAALIRDGERWWIVFYAVTNDGPYGRDLVQ